MPCSSKKIVFFALSAFVLLAAHSATAAVSPNIESYVPTNLLDFSAKIHLLRYDADAGRRINKDFGAIYEWMKKSRGDLQIRFKLPDMMRLDGRFGASNGSFIVNGTKQTVRLSLGIHETSDLGNSPGKRKTLLDVGLISRDYLSYTTAKFMGERPFMGKPCALFQISYRDKSLDTSYRMVWIDPDTKVTLKREEYSQTGKLLSIWYYKDIDKVAPGVYMPGVIEIDDSEGNLAGETSYRDIKANTPMPESLFR